MGGHGSALFGAAPAAAAGAMTAAATAVPAPFAFGAGAGVGGGFGALGGGFSMGADDAGGGKAPAVARKFSKAKRPGGLKKG